MKKTLSLLLLWLLPLPLFASAWHTITIQNHSSRAVILSEYDESSRQGCTYPPVKLTPGSRIASGGTATLEWNDKNSGNSCYDLQKWQAVKVSFEGSPPGVWSGYLGMVHWLHDCSPFSCQWADGLFYAQDIGSPTYKDGGKKVYYNGTDGEVPPPYIVASCTGTKDGVSSGCMKGFTHMVDPNLSNGDYIEPPYYQSTGDGWTFIINEPYRNLTVSEPQAGSRHEADYTLTPAGTATPGATVSFSLAGCPAGRSADCSIPSVTADGQGNWRAATRTLTTSPGYTLSVTQTIDGHAGPNNPQTRAFTVYNPDVNSQISAPANLSWIDTGQTVTVLGSVTPAGDAAKVRCYMDGRDTGVTPNIQGSAGGWGCRFPPPSAGKHTFSGRVEPEHPGDNDAVFTYMTADPLTVTAPAAGATLYPPVTLSGKQQAGSVVRWTSDHCGSGTAVSTGSSWTTPPVSGQGACTFSFTQTWQEMTSPPVTRALTLEPPPVLTSPADVAQDTRYPLAGKGEPGATIGVSLEDGWYPIDTVTVGADGRWSSEAGPLSGCGEYTLTLKQTMAGQPSVTTETPLVVEDPAATRDSGTEKESTK